MQLTYFYSKKYVRDDVKVKVLGYSDYKTIAELFPEGIRGRYNFYFSSNSIVEQEREKQETEEFYTIAIGNPIVGMNPVNLWKALEMVGKAKGKKNLDNIFQKPPEAEVLSPDEALRRIVSGQFDVVPDPGIDAPHYLTKIKIFMRTDAFNKAEDEIKAAVMLLLQRVQAIQMGQMKAMQDAMLLREMSGAVAGAQGGGMGPEGGPQPPGGAPPPGAGLQVA